MKRFSLTGAGLLILMCLLITNPLSARPAAALSDCSRFVADLNYPDGTRVSPGQSFTKSWRLQNCGDTTWSGFQAVRVGGGYGPGNFSIPAIGPGQSGDLSTSITAPASAGTHRATYRLQGPRGQFGTTFWVEVIVGTPQADYGFLATLRLPWRCGDHDPRKLTSDWTGHWAEHRATGFALDFGGFPNGYAVHTTDVLAPASGRLTKHFSATGYGHHIIIDPGNGWQILVAHLEEESQAGPNVSAGDKIGRLGRSGKSTGPHIHVEVRLASSESVDPNQIGQIFGRPRDHFRHNGQDKPISNPCGGSLRSDLNKDCAVDSLDFSIMLSNYGTTNAVADINRDGIVNALDLSALLSDYGKTCGSA